MILKDLTQKTLISDQAKIANSFSDRLFGLLNPRNPRFLIFSTHFGIHTLFMKTSIDVLLLNHEQTVVQMRKDLAPNRLFLYHPKYSVVIEMPGGTIHKFNIRVDDKIFIG